MSYVLSRDAVEDLIQIWRYIKRQSTAEMADRVETAIRAKFVILAETPGAGHIRKNLTEEDVRFFTVYSYLIVYRPQDKPLRIVSILHGSRDVARVLKTRL